MLFDNQINEDLLTIPLTEPILTRQYGCSNLLTLISVDTEVNFDEYVFKSIPKFDNLCNSSNLCNSNTKNLPNIKRHNSDSKHTTKSPNVKRINTF